ncbi:MAG: hypothetical protein LH473_03815 [Chitinophagales bacterium]|nr:hypothetical protein [Chitinophagales bacterium]
MKKLKDVMVEEVTHPFFTHMGIPKAFGLYSLRLSSLLTTGNSGNGSYYTIDGGYAAQ